MARTMVYNFTMPREKKPAATVKKNRTVEDEKKIMKMYWHKNMFLRVLKEVHPNIGITTGAMEDMKNIISNMMLKLVQKSYEVNLRRKKKSKLSVKDIMFAVMEVFPPQMAKLARTAARKALTNHRVTNLADKMDRMSINNDDAVIEAFPPQMPNLSRKALTDHHVTQLAHKIWIELRLSNSSK
ncbi:putative histone H2B-like protein [Trifolium pratense]|uniref:Putative histone H2B-like protein n=1 Tax=Trifolium pratense TaxID=57577 RepID=A0A2K3MBL4_TRIPR|nr:putative histone H2B-like protein [Trifolium pratense]PNX88169.1 putative histone H2B-like protein [Trifolium pratense]